MSETVVRRQDVAVLCKRTRDEQSAIERAWAQLEAALGSLGGRKFYGVFDPASGEYRACVERQDRDDPEALGLDEGLLSGGPYARARLTGEPPGVYRLIAPAFERLAQRPDRDATRPSIEFYRRRDVIELLLPVTA